MLINSTLLSSLNGKHKVGYKENPAHLKEILLYYFHFKVLLYLQDKKISWRKWDFNKKKRPQEVSLTWHDDRDLKKGHFLTKDTHLMRLTGNHFRLILLTLEDLSSFYISIQEIISLGRCISCIHQIYQMYTCSASIKS